MREKRLMADTFTTLRNNTKEVMYYLSADELPDIDRELDWDC